MDLYRNFVLLASLLFTTMWVPGVMALCVPNGRERIEDTDSVRDVSIGIGSSRNISYF